MALEVTAAIIGILAAAGKVAEILGPYVSAWKHAPKNAAAILSEVNASRVCLSALQGLLNDLDSSPRSRKSLIQIDHLIATFTDGVLLFSELEAMITDIKGSRTQWAWSDKKIAEIVSRLQCFKGSISVMLNILQCGSDQEAIRSGQELFSIASSLLQRNIDLSRRMARLEDHLMTDDAIRTTRPASITTTIFRVQDEPSTELSNTKGKISLSVRRSFELDLITSRVYQKVRRRTSHDSFRSSIALSHAWSALSDTSLSNLSTISIIALPVQWTEISNVQHYRFSDTTTSSELVELQRTTDREMSLPPRSPITSKFNRPNQTRIFVYGMELFQLKSLTNHWTEQDLNIAKNSGAQRIIGHFSKEFVIGASPVSLDIATLHERPSDWNHVPDINEFIHSDRAELFILVFSVKSRLSLHSIRLCIEKIVREKGFLYHSVIIVANHCDDSMGQSELMLLVEGEGLAQRLGYKFYRESRDLGITIESAIHELVQAKWKYERVQHEQRKSLRLRQEKRGQTVASSADRLLFI